MSQPRMDNGEWMMRAQREYQARPYREAWAAEWLRQIYEQEMRRQESEPEDTTGLKMLEEFLAKRKGERDGNPDERK